MGAGQEVGGTPGCQRRVRGEGGKRGGHTWVSGGSRGLQHHTSPPPPSVPPAVSLQGGKFDLAQDLPRVPDTYIALSCSLLSLFRAASSIWPRICARSASSTTSRVPRRGRCDHWGGG